MTPSPAELRADCEKCVGLCCVAHAFAKSADFGIDKPAGVACPHLRVDFGCEIHPRLRQDGFSGCAAYDCFGAGQKVVQVTFNGQDWRTTPSIAEQMFAAFMVMRQLHELMWYLSEALHLEDAKPLHLVLEGALATTREMTHSSPQGLAELNVAAHRERVNALLVNASEMVRTEFRGADFRGADLIGKDLSGSDLRGANFRGAMLVGANMSGADLRKADLTGADVRGANLRGANLSETLFVTQAQLDTAVGDEETKLPRSRLRPSHWPSKRV